MSWGTDRCDAAVTRAPLLFLVTTRRELGIAGPLVGRCREAGIEIRRRCGQGLIRIAALKLTDRRGGGIELAPALRHAYGRMPIPGPCSNRPAFTPATHASSATPPVLH
jgi:hypothetical protein